MATRVVCFDIGGVLVRIHHNMGRAAIALGLTVPAGTEDTPLSNPMVDAYQGGKITADEYYARLGEHFDCPPEQARAVHASIPIEPYAGTETVIQALEALEIATGCLSNTSAEHWERLIDPAQFPNVARLQTKVASHLAGLHKPELAIFRLFEAEASARPEEILFFDDSLSNFLGAREAGWRAERIDPEGDPAQQLIAHLQTHGIRIG